MIAIDIDIQRIEAERVDLERTAVGGLLYTDRQAVLRALYRDDGTDQHEQSVSQVLRVASGKEAEWPLSPFGVNDERPEIENRGTAILF